MGWHLRSDTCMCVYPDNRCHTAGCTQSRPLGDSDRNGLRPGGNRNSCSSGIHVRVGRGVRYVLCGGPVGAGRVQLLNSLQTIVYIALLNNHILTDYGVLGVARRGCGSSSQSSRLLNVASWSCSGPLDLRHMSRWRKCDWWAAYKASLYTSISQVRCCVVQCMNVFM
jgi:hypothetical protein